jgi:hypothetical protein
MKVTAIRRGFYNNRRVKEGDVVSISKGEFSAAWMEPVGTVPAEFADEVALKQEEFKSRPSLNARRAEASLVPAKALAEAVATGVRLGMEQARAEHAALLKANGTPAVATAPALDTTDAKGDQENAKVDQPGSKADHSKRK